MRAPPPTSSPPPNVTRTRTGRAACRDPRRPRSVGRRRARRPVRRRANGPAHAPSPSPTSSSSVVPARGSARADARVRLRAAPRRGRRAVHRRDRAERPLRRRRGDGRRLGTARRPAARPARQPRQPRHRHRDPGRDRPRARRRSARLPAHPLERERRHRRRSRPGLAPFLRRHARGHRGRRPVDRRELRATPALRAVRGGSRAIRPGARLRRPSDRHGRGPRAAPARRPYAVVSRAAARAHRLARTPLPGSSLLAAGPRRGHRRDGPRRRVRRCPSRPRPSSSCSAHRAPSIASSSPGRPRSCRRGLARRPASASRIWRPRRWRTFARSANGGSVRMPRLFRGDRHGAPVRLAAT